MINDNDEEVLISDTMYPRAFAHVAPSSLKLRDSMANLSEQAIVSGHRGFVTLRNCLYFCHIASTRDGTLELGHFSETGYGSEVDAKLSLPALASLAQRTWLRSNMVKLLIRNCCGTAQFRLHNCSGYRSLKSSGVLSPYSRLGR